MKKGEYKEENGPFIPPICNITTNYCNIFENMGEGISIFELINDKNEKVVDLQVNYINHASILNKFGSREEITGKTITELCGPHKVGLYLKIANDVVLTGKNIRYKIHFAQFNKYFLINAFSPHKNICITIDVDISKEKEAEYYLKESEKKFKSLFENNNDAIILIDQRTSKHIDANRKAAELTGYSKEELTSMSAGDLTPEDLKGEIVDWFKKLPKKNKRIETEIITKDLKRIPVEASATIIELNGLSYIQALFRDIIERKKMENTLKESETRYRTIFENTGIPFMIIEEDMTISLINDEMEKTFGYLKEEVEGKRKWTEFVASKEDLERMKKYHRIRRENPEAAPKEYEYRAIAKDGSIKDVLINIAMIPETKRSIASFIDITERKKAEEEVKNSQQMLETVLEHFPGVVFWKDYNSVYLGCNRNFSIGAGFDNPSEIIGKTDYEMPWGSTEAEDYRADDRQVMDSGTSKLHIIETQLQSDGSLIWFDTNKIPLFDSKDKVIGILGVSHDITELKEAEEKLKHAYDHLEEQVEERTAELEEANEALEERELQYKTLAENSPDLILRVNTDLKCIYVNSTITKYTNMPPESFIGKTIDELSLPKKYNSQFKEDYHKLFKTGETQNLEYKLPTIEGYKFFHATTVPEFNPNGNIETALSVIRDITTIKRSENKLKEIVTELERSNQELQSFAYITSHDLQEPLRTMASYAQLLKRRYGGQLDSDADEFIEFMVNGASRMKGMIQGLLDYSRVGTRGEEFKEFNAIKALNDALLNLESSIKESNAEITHDKLPNIVADENQISRVFQNLIGNAIKFRKPDEPSRIHISAKKIDDEYIFSVSDNSIGIEQDYIDQIFEVFKRLHTIDEYEGAGIGLAIVKRIVDRHNGRVWAESEYDKGSTFYFTIPMNI